MQPKILVVDDDSEILETLKFFLETENFLVDLVDDAIKAIKKLDTTDYNLIILDLMLPDLEGEHLCKLIKSKKDIPVLILSAKDSVEAKLLCFEYGADDYLTKPFYKMELLARVKAILKRYKVNLAVNNKNYVFNISDLKIDLKKRKLYKNNRIIELTNREWDILIFLIDNANNVVSREKIKERIWGESKLFTVDHNLDVQIAHIRQKIENNPKNPVIIKTIPGIGYKVEVKV
jgi:two-component system alkaline phosphatase synthesis response regulator PhoP